MSSKEESSALEFLDSLIEDTPQVQRAARRERLRLELARFMKKAREVAGLTQKEVAETLGVTQAWVSKLESPNFDHKLESVLSFFDAIGGDMKLSVDVAESTFQIWGKAPVWSVLMVPVETQRRGRQLFSTTIEHTWSLPFQENQEAAETQSDRVFHFNDLAGFHGSGLTIREAEAQ
jgi:transcriptional regulator with XRE-family HTH domain